MLVKTYNTEGTLIHTDKISTNGGRDEYISLAKQNLIDDGILEEHESSERTYVLAEEE
mgnify:CR=1 FL=1|tara:strand:+ start:486 stop:659 length:174 start_codon:yes stop_codon:yes gene_type:complete